MGAKDSASTMVETISFAKPVDADESQPLPALADAIARVQDAPVVLEVRLGEILLTVRELQALHTGSVVALDRSLDEPVDIIVNGQVVARGCLVAYEDRYGVQVTEIGAAS